MRESSRSRAEAERARCGEVAVLFQDRADVEEGVADGAGAADLEQVGQDPVGVGDLLQEDAALGSGLALSAALLVAALLYRGRLSQGQAADQFFQGVTVHAGQVKRSVVGMRG